MSYTETQELKVALAEQASTIRQLQEQMARLERRVNQVVVDPTAVIVENQ